MYKVVFWEYDGDFSTVYGQLSDLKHLIRLLDESSSYWQLYLDEELMEQCPQIMDDCFAGHRKVN
jgi:hypothetical protein